MTIGMVFGVGFAALLFHFILWQIRVPSRPTRALAAILGTGLLLTDGIGLAMVPGFGLGDLLYATALYGSVSVCYLLAYTVIQWDSPSLTLTHFILEAGENGRTHKELEDFCRSRGLVASRYSDLKRDGLIVERGELVSLGGKTSLAIRIGELYRRAMGRESQGLD